MASILLVDGDSYVVRLYADMLARAGHRVSAASKPAEVAPLLDGQYDVAVIELAFSFEQGLKLAERLRKDVAVYAITKAGDSALVQPALKLGIVDFLHKPIEGDHLNLLVQRRLSQ